MFNLSHWQILVIGISGVLIAAAAGAMANGWWHRRTAREKRRIPRQWPLAPRALANSEERYLWRWLARVFFDHHVMVKLPVTRFTMPRSREQGLHWYELLSGLYSTFTVVDANGRVWACVDVKGRAGMSKSNQQLKKTLLHQCGIVYLVVEPSRLPGVTDMRRAVLGDAADMTGNQRDEAIIAKARENLRASLQRQRRTRDSDRAPLAASDGSPVTQSSSFLDSQSSSAWQTNSFITPLDSRKADLG